MHFQLHVGIEQEHSRINVDVSQLVGLLNPGLFNTCKLHVKVYTAVRVNNKVFPDNGCNHVLCSLVAAHLLFCTCQQLGYNG